MQHTSDDTSLLFIESDQRADTFVQHSLGQVAIARLLSWRCQDAQAQDLPSQDYVRVISDRKGSSICFCVCDGVGSSYKGDFAAQYLAGCLVEWLQKMVIFPRKSSKLLRTLRPRLDQWARDAQTTLICSDISPELPALVREVLEELRHTYGSEAVFLCGRIDSLEQSLSRAHSPGVQASFCWMGNVSARLFTAGSQSIEMGNRDDDANRWSTVRGRQGMVRTQILTLDSIDRLMIYTDGLETIRGELADLSDDELQMRARQLLTLPTNDDMTVLDLQWLHVISE